MTDLTSHVFNSLESRPEQERQKYRDIWARLDYRIRSPGEYYVQHFQEIAKPIYGQRIIDIGCGEGAACVALRDRCGLICHGIDLVNPGLKLEMPFEACCLWQSWGQFEAQVFRYGYCCDVMEHIPTEYVALALSRIRHHCMEGFFSIASFQDTRDDIELHLTIKPFKWWFDLIGEFGNVVDARDLIDRYVIYVRFN
jgi:2-polyprenyl-3-methyl-5-hydroxy-6-metoxy-1,4-benzoquinol methylase